jgi:hypothetical protein
LPTTTIPSRESIAAPVTTDKRNVDLVSTLPRNPNERSRLPSGLYRARSREPPAATILPLESIVTALALAPSSRLVLTIPSAEKDGVTRASPGPVGHERLLTISNRLVSVA